MGGEGAQIDDGGAGGGDVLEGDEGGEGGEGGGG